MILARLAPAAANRLPRPPAARRPRLRVGAMVLALPLLAAACTSEEAGPDIEVQQRGPAGRGGASTQAGAGGTGDQAAGSGGDEGNDGGSGGGNPGGAGTTSGGAGTSGTSGTGGKGGASGASSKGGTGGGTGGSNVGGSGAGGGTSTAGSGGAAGKGGFGGKAGSAGKGGSAGTNAAGSAGTSVGGSGGTGEGGAAGGAGVVSCPVTIEPVLTFTLENAAFPGTGHPDAAVHVPPGFDACDAPGLIVFFHGFNNCVVNAIGSNDTACTPGGSSRTALRLADQLDASGANAILVAVELKFDQATGNPGALSEQGRLKALLDEIFTQSLATKLGKPLDVDAFDRVVLSSHSGGYWAVAEGLQNGGLSNIREVDLYDSLYGEYATYKSFLDDHASSFSVNANVDKPHRFAAVWTSGGGTANLSVDLQADAQAALDGVGLGSAMLYDPTTGTFADEDYLHPVIFKRSGLSHDGVPQYYFERLAKVGFRQRQ